jgi:Tfp pilus assembly protein PilF
MYFDQGRQSFARQEYDNAADLMRKAVEVDPHFEDAHRYLAESYNKLGYSHRAKKAWEALLRVCKNEQQRAEIQGKLNQL